MPSDLTDTLTKLVNSLTEAFRFHRKSKRIRLTECVPLFALIGTGVVFLRTMQAYEPLYEWVFLLVLMCAVGVSQATKRIIYVRSKSHYVRRLVIFLLKTVAVSFVFVYGFDHDKTLVEIFVDRLELPISYSDLSVYEGAVISLVALCVAIFTAPFQFPDNASPVGWKFRLLQLLVGFAFAYFVILQDKFLFLFSQSIVG